MAKRLTDKVTWVGKIDWELKHYNPEMEVECVVDPDTYDQVMGCYRRQALSVIDRLVRVEVPAQFGKKERSKRITPTRAEVT